ncbi:divalent-cation tolerance protein CutA isoform X1 [Octopus bimaculoides]|uniref:Protein CutA homolog n=2 Tax=Octopus bimaculoides TaxID=37653 RepID=A0A0L8G4A2_OCTBM|nr:divalent-cation tolerance protein CutA isoform X1 [Octopus bimaculoides]|eukprot:XP_014784208.1 PREDICTED: divalent-cation tolerance protein CutA-like isoform X1 [Octopus bimaculoides]
MALTTLLRPAIFSTKGIISVILLLIVFQQLSSRFGFSRILSPLIMSSGPMHQTNMGSETNFNQSGVYSMAFVTVPDINVAKHIAGGLVREKLAACVNIIPGVISVYEWENEVNEDPEILLMIKTRTSRVNDVVEFVRGNHPYDVAEVISTPIDKGNAPYLKWIADIVPQK